MRIKTFCKTIRDEEVESLKINNMTVVIDGQNFFHHMYRNSGLPYVFGCESDRYADYLRKYLRMFKKANLTCYFIFKGGHEGITNKFKSMNDSKYVLGTNFTVGVDDTRCDIVFPIFMKDVYKQVIDEMGFKSTVCEYESKVECIALAQKLKCPVVSFDIEFCFSYVPYISYTSLKFNAEDNSLTCGVFSLEKFLHKHHLTEEKLALFIVLTDRKIFLEDTLMGFIKSLRIPIGNYKRNQALLSWLAKVSRKEAVDRVFLFLNKEEQLKFLESEKKALAMIRRQEKMGIPANYLLEIGHQLSDNDPAWFEKGVALKHIATPYINLYKSKIFIGSLALEDKDSDDSLILSLDIIKYAFNLLTNFQNNGFIFYNKNDTKTTILTTGDNSVPKPDYVATSSVFENGWDDLLKLRLFEHFIIESLHFNDMKTIQALPKEARLLIVALIYFARKKRTGYSSVAWSVLTSYVMLNVVNRKKNVDRTVLAQTFPKPISDELSIENVTETDCEIASSVMSEYFQVNDNETKRIFDGKILHPLVEFEHCLCQLNYLNTLCGAPYSATVYCRTFNGTLSYKVLHAMKQENDLDLINRKLNLAPTVLSYIKGLASVFFKIRDDF